MLKNILIIDDSFSYPSLLKNKLETNLNVNCQLINDADVTLNKIGNYAIYFIRLNDKNKNLIDKLIDDEKIVVLLTDYDDVETRKEIQISGASDYILTHKTSTGDVALTIARRLINNIKLTVMIVDDSPLILSTLAIILETQNLNYIKCKNGQEAWEYINNPDTTTIDLIITDYEMPIMDGYELIKLVRTQFPLEELPILVLSGTEDTSIIAKFLKNGANDYIPKPFINEEFIARISNSLNILEMFKKIRNMAMTDHLTGLHNRSYFYQAGEQLLAIEKRSYIPLSICMIDIDNFKSINDTYGHDTGDRALKYIANALKSNIRDSDIVIRFGGEEFIILLPNCPVNEAYRVINKMTKRIADSVFYLDNGDELRITISSGVTSKLGSLDSMVIEADKYMYIAKQSGKNQVYTQELD